MADIVLLFVLKGRDCMSKVLIEVLVIILIAGSYLILYSAVRVSAIADQRIAEIQRRETFDKEKQLNEKGFSARNLWNMKKWYLFYSSSDIFSEMAHTIEDSIDLNSLKLQQVGAEISENQKLHQAGAEVHLLIVLKQIYINHQVMHLLILPKNFLPYKENSHRK